MHMRPSGCKVRLQIEFGCLSPGACSVMTNAFVALSIVAERHTSAPPSPSCASTTFPERGNSSSLVPRRSLVITRILSPSSL
eukprot:6211424-Pleurochrysis_carterae.AAC.7